jgi:hypothetical protein
MPPVFLIEPTRVAGQKPAHEHRYCNQSGSQQEMGVVFEKTPGETIGFRFGDQFRKPVHEIQPISVGPEYQFDPSDDHVMQRSRRV